MADTRNPRTTPADSPSTRSRSSIREADRLNKSFGKDFRILKGIGSDILADGSLDYPDEVLESFDFDVASIHGRFKLDKNSQTDRLLRAISNHRRPENPWAAGTGRPSRRCGSRDYRAPSRR